MVFTKSLSRIGSSLTTFTTPLQRPSTAATTAPAASSTCTQLLNTPIAGLVLASERSQPGREATWSVQSTEAEHADLRALAGEAHHPLLAVQQHVPMISAGEAGVVLSTQSSAAWPYTASAGVTICPNPQRRHHGIQAVEAVQEGGSVSIGIHPTVALGPR